MASNLFIQVELFMIFRLKASICISTSRPAQAHTNGNASFQIQHVTYDYHVQDLYNLHFTDDPINQPFHEETLS